MNAPGTVRAERGSLLSLGPADPAVHAYLSLPPGGAGPGLLLAVPQLDAAARQLADYYAEEGYVVLAPDPAVDMGNAQRAALEALCARTECAGAVTAVGFGVSAATLALLTHGNKLAAAAFYWPEPVEPVFGELANSGCPIMLHFPEHGPVAGAQAMAEARVARGARKDVELYLYPEQYPGFAWSGHPAQNLPAAGIAYSRTLGMLRRAVGPHYDLAAIFDEHVMLEFGARDADATIATMVDDPYVNSVPTLTGGVGKAHLHRFYKYHFIPRNPPDSRMVPISRTVGPDRLVDEFIMCFTHSEEIDYMLPGIAATGRYVELPMVIVASFRGDKVYNEHIYWDQATVLVQIGMLDPTGLPVTGAEQAQKLRDKDYPSNALMEAVWKRSESGAAADRAALEGHAG